VSVLPCNAEISIQPLAAQGTGHKQTKKEAKGQRRKEEKKQNQVIFKFKSK
jgi:hypothetical protein